MSHIRHSHWYIVSAEDVTVDQFRAPAQHMNTQGQDHGWSTWVHLLVRPLQRLQPMSRPDWTCGRRHCREQVTIYTSHDTVIDLQHFFLPVSQCRFVKRLIATTTVGEGGSLFGSWNLIVHTPLRLSIHGAAIGGKKQYYRLESF